MTGTENPSTITKTCSHCGIDVSHAKRFKGSDGRYFCESCNKRDKQARGPGGSVCPICHKRVPPVEMVKIGARYVCDACSTTDAAKAGAATAVEVPPEKRRVRNLLLVLGVLLTIMALVWWDAYF